MNKVVSTALFGNGDKYGRFLPTFVLAHLNLFPRDEGWQLQVHIDPAAADSRHGRLLFNLDREGWAEVSIHKEAPLCKAMLWRMAPVFEEEAGFVFCRDVDALPTPRDRACCDLFVASDCACHTIHDSLSHVGIMGGLCGFRASSFRAATGLHSLDDLYASTGTGELAWGRHGTDQIVLNRLVDRAGGPSLLEHRYSGWHCGPGKFVPRPAGRYRCQAMSMRVPDDYDTVRFSAARSLGETRALARQADLLAGHMGTAGYDEAAGRVFWEQHGRRDLTEVVRFCEGMQ